MPWPPAPSCLPTVTGTPIMLLSFSPVFSIVVQLFRRWARRFFVLGRTRGRVRDVLPLLTVGWALPLVRVEHPRDVLPGRRRRRILSLNRFGDPGHCHRHVVPAASAGYLR